MPVEPIAVIGMAGRFPASPDLDAFWSRLENCEDCVSDLSRADLLHAGEDPAAVDDPDYVAARPLMPNVREFDAEFFGMSAREAALRDPQHRLMLQLSHDALSSAGYDPARYPKPIGVFAGAGANRYLDLHVRSRPDVLKTAGGLLIDIASNPDYLTTLTAFKLGLTGPAMTVATACSTSLVAVHQACQSLRVGDCAMALAGGVEIEFPYGTGYVYQDGGILSRDGRCRSFDAEADGTNFGSGAGLVLLKRYADAVAEGDHVLAVLRGSAVNNDGAVKAGFSAPSARGQAACIAEALTSSGVAASQISYVEAHGTGTALGDPIELSALADGWRSVTADGELEPGRCLVGSVKSNIGHAGRAAGVAGLIKVILSMRHGRIPGTAHLHEVNPRLDIDELPFRVTGETTDWTCAGPRIAAVSAFGIGGTNAHVIVEEPPPAPLRSAAIDGPLLAAVSAKTPDALRTSRDRLVSDLQASPGDASDVLATYAAARTSMKHRFSAVVRSADRAAEDVDAAAPHDVDEMPGRIVWVFPGQGAQRIRMGLELARDNASFRSRLDQLLQALSDELGRDLSADLAGETRVDLAATELAQPLLFAVEVALAEELHELGLRPDLVVGHSVGELVAAVVAGVLGRDSAVTAVAERARALGEAPPGAMIAVGAPPIDIADLLGVDVWLAAQNAPGQSVIGGDETAVSKVAAIIEERGLSVTALRTSRAFHTPLMAAAAERFTEAMTRVPLLAPTIDIVSAAAAKVMSPQEATDPAFWGRQLASPVMFDAASALVAGEPSLALEVGPGDTLTALLRRTHAIPGLALLDNRRCPDETTSFLTAIGKLWAAGHDIALERLWQPGTTRRMPVAPYPFARDEHWIDRPAAVDAPALVEGPTTVPDAQAVEGAGSGKQPAAQAEEDATGRAQPPAGPAGDDARDDDDPRVDDLLSRPTWVQRAGDVRARDLPATPASALLVTGAGVGADAPLLRLVERALRSQGYGTRTVDGGAAAAADLAAASGPRGADLIVHIAGDGSDVTAAIWSLLSTVQAALRCKGQQQPTLVVASRGAVDPSGGGDVVASAAALTGVVASLRHEHSELSPRQVDVGVGADIEALGALLSSADEPLLAVRGRQVWTRDWEPVVPDQTVSLRRGGVYVITGGLRGIGLATAQALAAAGDEMTLALLSRTGVPAAADVLELIADTGCRVLSFGVDVCDADALTATLREVVASAGPINGVVHAAGVAGGGLAALRTQEQVSAVVEPKVRGLRNLMTGLSQVGDRQLDFVLLYSSRAAWRGLLGSADYAGANAFLDAAALAAEGGPRVLSVQWPSWSETGMAVTPSREPSSTPAKETRVVTRTVRADDWRVVEHRVDDAPVLPGAAFLDLIVSGLRDLGTDLDTFVLRDVLLVAPLVVLDDVEIEVRVCDGDGSGRRDVEVAARDGEGSWHTYATCSVAEQALPAPDPVDAGAIRGLLAGSDSVDSRGGRVLFGPRWGKPGPVLRTDAGALASVDLAEEYWADLEQHTLHPAVLDQVLGAVQPEPTDRLPYCYGSVRVLAPLPPSVLVSVEDMQETNAGCSADVTAYDLLGRPVLVVAGVLLRSRKELVGSAAPHAERRPPSPAHASTRRFPATAPGPASGLTTALGVRTAVRLARAGLCGVVSVSLPGELTPDRPGRQTPDAAPVAVPPVAVPPVPVPPFPAPPVPTPPVPTAPAAAAPTRSEESAEGGPGSIEDRLHGLWAEMLGADQVEIDADFFDLGGDSLVAVQLMSATRSMFGVDVSVGTLFERPTLRQMAAKVAQG